MIMLCVSTEQNTTNLIPAIQLTEIDTVVIIESAKAEMKHWSFGMIEVLKKRKIKTDKIALKAGDGNGGEDTQVEWIVMKINKYLEQNIKPADPIYWNIGGGLKPFILAMYQCFIQRNGRLDKICYTNPFNSKPSIDFIQNLNGTQISSSSIIDVDLNAYEIIATYGLKISSARQFYSKKEPKTIDSFPDYFRFKEFRNYVFELPKARIVDLTEDIDLEDLADIFNDPQKYAFFIDSIKNELYKRFSKESVSKQEIKSAHEAMLAGTNIKQQHFFEGEKMNKFVDYLRSFMIKTKDDFHNSLFAKTINYQNKVNEIDIKNEELHTQLNAKSIRVDDTLLKTLGFNSGARYFEGIIEKRVYEFLKSNNHKIIEAFSNVSVASNDTLIAEYDVLLLTNHGTVIALEAKTFDFTQKDMDARQFNLEKASSRIVEMYIVFPYDPEDFNEANFPGKLADLPFKLKERNMNFLVIADSVNSKDFRVNRVNNKLAEVDNGGLQINKLESLFDKLSK
ncbi:hypothetical protein [Emticicia fluvialis]|uniref:hypothetical protein n=1 Tax=Emticicia fluvialis TaxID=2974474 RepID=UPI0021664BA5|nr:hypothetical protein [Emticicia fluvialis]